MKANLLAMAPIALLASALVGLTSQHARAEARDVFTKSFAVASGGQLMVQLDRGSIEVKTADANEVNIEIVRKADSERVLKDHVITATFENNTVRVTGEYTGPNSSGWFRKSPRLKITCHITVPRKFDADLKTAGGNVSVIELTGKTEARTSGGNLNFEKLDGPLTARTSGGNVDAANCRGGVDVRTSGGDIRLTNIDGAAVARTSGGAIRAHHIVGNTEVKTSGGDIEVTDIKGKVEAGTSGGNVVARLSAAPAEDCSFKTSGGDVTVALVADAAVNVDAHTSGGHVSTDLPIVRTTEGKQKRTELRGKLNGGGPLILARTSGGNVQIEKN